MRDFDLDNITAHAIIALLWSTTVYSTDDEWTGNLDDEFTWEDVDAEEVAEIRKYVEEFVTANGDDLTLTGASDEQIGHDFTLTANRHGVGFWDRGYGPVGERLSEAAHEFGEINAWAENGQVHVGM